MGEGTYKGQWFGDQKNGQGILYLENGDIIYGFWIQDVLNGCAKIKYKGFSDKQLEIFKNFFLKTRNLQKFNFKNGM